MKQARLRDGAKEDLNKAFRDLRKVGYFAKQNFWCCQTCALADIPDEKAAKYVYYHNQDNDDLKRRGNCYLGWAGDGKEIVNILTSHGIKTNWVGSKDQRIGIDLTQ